MATETAEQFAMKCIIEMQDEENKKWEQRRYEMAKEIFIGNLCMYDSLKSSAQYAVKHADALIKELRADKRK